MAKIERSFIINVPVEKVFSYLSDPTKLSEWLPSLSTVRNIRGKGLGQRANWTYKMMGMPFKGELEYISSERIIMKTMGSIKSTWDWVFKSQSKKTLVNLVLEYTIPVPLISKVGNRLILGQNEREADMAVDNIKERLEWKEQFKIMR